MGSNYLALKFNWLTWKCSTGVQQRQFSWLQTSSYCFRSKLPRCNTHVPSYESIQPTPIKLNNKEYYTNVSLILWNTSYIYNNITVAGPCSMNFSITIVVSYGGTKISINEQKLMIRKHFQSKFVCGSIGLSLDFQKIENF